MPHLSWTDRLVAAEAWLTMAWVSMRIRKSGHKRMEERMQVRGGCPCAEPCVLRIVRLVDGAASHHVKEMQCLERAITVQTMLRRRGCQTTLRLGVRRVGHQVEAHAWLEGAPGLQDPLSDQFTKLGFSGERSN